LKLVVVIACSILPGLCRRSFAQVDPWEFEVYPQTIGREKMELESLNSIVANGHSEGDSGTSSGDFPSEHMYRTAFELTYGFTDKFEAAAYLNLAKPNGHDLQYRARSIASAAASSIRESSRWTSATTSSSNGTRRRSSTTASSSSS
jgi:hypothetical protein